MRGDARAAGTSGVWPLRVWAWGSWFDNESKANTALRVRGDLEMDLLLRLHSLRDIRFQTQSGQWTVDTLVFFFLFPQNFHFSVSPTLPEVQHQINAVQKYWTRLFLMSSSVVLLNSSYMSLFFFETDVS